MTSPPDKSNEVLAAIAGFQERLDQLFKSYDEQAKSQRDYSDALLAYVQAVKTQVDAQGLTLKSVADAQAKSAAIIDRLAEGFDDLNTRVNGLEAKVDGLNTRVNGLDAKFDGLNTRMNGLEAKVDGLTDDIAEVKGEHALSSVLRRAHLVADALGCDLIAEVPRGVLLGLAKIAEANGESGSDVESFKNADMILHVLSPDNQPGYVAVEASFTVDCRDVTRAARNAGYLNKYTGLPSYGVVAGVDVLKDAQKQIETGTVQHYRIQRRELQPA